MDKFDLLIAKWEHEANKHEQSAGEMKDEKDWPSRVEVAMHEEAARVYRECSRHLQAVMKGD